MLPAVDPVLQLERPPEAAAAAAAASGHAQRPRIAPETLHPSLWLGHQLGRQASDAVSTGYAGLDAELPGRGWPRRCLTELLAPHPGLGEIRLLAPALVQMQARVVMLFDPPFQLSATALASYGMDPGRIVVVQTRTRGVPGSDSVWPVEQALKGGHVGAIVVWLPPRFRAERMRRLQLAANNHDGLAFVLRETAAGGQPSASPLRLALSAGGVDCLRVEVLKRRGPPQTQPLMLELPSVLSPAAKRRSANALVPAPGQTVVAG
jgi:protein ImuA